MTLIGQRLLKSNSITPSQLKQALERQRLQGGRLGNNLVALGFIEEQDCQALFNPIPKEPKSFQETGLTEVFINELILKHALDMGEFTITDMSDQLKLSLPLMDKSLDVLRKERFVEVKGATQLSKLSYHFALTDAGRSKAAHLKEIQRYTGPAPVPFEEYKGMVEMQTIKNISINEQILRHAFKNIVIDDTLLRRLGIAVNSGKAIFLYGPPGNGKTTIAETVGELLPGEIYVPHAIMTDGEIITVFDSAIHEPVLTKSGSDDDPIDQRWIRVKRPVIMVGGEMTLKGLDLDYNQVSKYYIAPLQLKANNGLFILDDFGRQQVEPQALLNRWIVPLERRTDFLSFHTGKKIEIPFDQLVIFSTNLEPKNLVDEAFLRRIRYKIKVDHPSLPEYKQIFQKVCQSNNICFDAVVFDFLINQLYKPNNVRFNSCHCRDLIDNIIDEAHFNARKPEITSESIQASWHSYHVDL